MRDEVAAGVRVAVGRLADLEGCELGTSRARLVDEVLVDRFAQASGHPRQGAAVPPPLVLALVAPVVGELLQVDGCSFAVNYGLDLVRFCHPVPVGQTLRGRARVGQVRGVGAWVQVIVHVEMLAGDEPVSACTAESVLRFHP